MQDTFFPIRKLKICPYLTIFNFNTDKFSLNPYRKKSVNKLHEEWFVDKIVSIDYDHLLRKLVVSNGIKWKKLSSSYAGS